MSALSWILILVVLLSLAYYAYRQQHREFGRALKRLAEQRVTPDPKARYSSGGLTSYPRLVVHHSEGPITVSAMASTGARSGAGPVTFARLTLTRISPLQFKLVRKTRSVQSLVDSAMHGSESRPGRVSFQRRFFIETDSPQDFEHVFSEELENVVSNASSISMVTCGEEVLAANAEGVCTDEQTLLSMSQCVGRVAEQLAELHRKKAGTP
ncbi:MAG: hypothetical protein AAF991_09015 [Pseudomonadota bacterium]